MGLTLVPASGLYSDVSVVKAADQQKTGTVDGYDYELWNQNYTGSVDMQVGSNGAFSCSWSNIENCLFRTGKKLGSTKKYQDYGTISINYDVDYQPMGNSYMCVYGWTEDPTVEYYIVEAWGDWRPPGATNSLGTVVSDGNQYDIYKTMRYDQPSIHGTETFAQYWSVKKTNPAQVNAMKNLKGTITVSNHFAAWEKAGLTMGKMYEVALNVEGYRSSGKANVKKNELVIGKEPTNTTTYITSTPTTDAPGSTPSGSGTGVSDGFEGTGTDWKARGDDVTLTLTNSFKHGGSKSLYIGGRTQSWNGASVSSSELKAGTSYSFSSYVGFNDSNYSSSDFTFGVQYDLDGETHYDNISDATASSGKWAELAGDFTVPSGAKNISLYVQTAYTETPAAKDLISFYLDDVKLSGGSSTPSTTTSNGSTTPQPSSDSLKDAFSSFFKIGTSVSPNELSSGASFIKKHFNSITPENELKPDALIDQGACQQRGNNVNTQISLNRASQTLKFCEDNGISLRGHTFVWYSQTPSWFFKENFSDNGAYVSKDIMNKRLESFIKNTFEAIKTQYPKLDLYAYDVCNELFLNDGGGLRPADNSNWVRVYGDDSFVIKAFEYARQYAPAGCKLYLNDYNEYIGAKTNDLYNMAMKLKANGTIDGIGMQSHLDVKYPSASTYKTALEKFISTGLDVQVTELDITCGDTTAQAKLFADIFQMCVDNADKISSLTVWGTHDSISWRRENNPLIFGSNYTPKQAYTEVMKVAANAAPKTTTPTTTTTTTTTTTQPSTPTTPDFKFGDINRDGKADITDLTMISLYLLSDINLDSTQMMSADVVYDKDVNLADLSLMKQYIMKDDVTLGKGYVAPATTTQRTTAQTTVQTTKATTQSQQSGSKTMSGSVVNGVWSSSADVSWIDTSKPMVAFTFDDGPVGTGGNATSMRIQNALKKSGFHATFFYWGNKINGSNSAEIKSAFDAGFEIGNHTYTHNSLSGMSGDAIRNEINQTKTILNGIVGAGDFLVRPPYLSVDQNASANAGVPLINCGIDTKDWDNASTSQIVSTLKNAMQNGSLRNKVVLMHETYETTAAAMEELLPYMKQQGWQVVSVSELFKANGKELRAGQVYTGC